MRKTLFLAALLAAVPMMSRAADVPVKVDVICIQSTLAYPERLPYRPREGGSFVLLRFTAPEGKVFVEDSASRQIVVLPCNDGAGKALENASINMSYRRITESGKVMFCGAKTVSLTSDGVLHLIGDVPVTMSKGKVKQPPVPVDVKEGSEANVADYEMQLVKIEPSNDKEGKIDVTFEVVGKEFVADMEFESLDGKKLSANLRRISDMQDGPYNTSEKRTYTFATKPEKMNLVVVQADTEKVNVPVDVKVNLSGPVK